MAEDNLCTLRFVRPSRFADWIRSYTIEVNGKEVGTIRANGTLEARLAPGATTIEAKIDWAKSQPLTINTMPHQTIEIEVSNRWGAWLALWAVTFGKDSYLLLTLRSGASGSNVHT